MDGFEAALCPLVPKATTPFGELVDVGRVLSLLGSPGWASVFLETKPGASGRAPRLRRGPALVPTREDFSITPGGRAFNGQETLKDGDSD